MAHKQQKKQSRICYIEAASLAEVCKHACGFGPVSEALLLSRFGNGQRLIALGERIGDTTLAYYFPTERLGKIVTYTPASPGAGEKVEFVGSADLPNKYYINIVSIDLDKLAAAKKVDRKDVEAVKMESAEDVIRAVIMKASKDETLGTSYLFPSKGGMAIGAFDVLEALADDKRFFYWAPCKEKAKSAFARYDYREAKLEFTDMVGEHSYLYVRIINLKEPFPFL